MQRRLRAFKTVSNEPVVPETGYAQFMFDVTYLHSTHLKLTSHITITSCTFGYVLIFITTTTMPTAVAATPTIFITLKVSFELYRIHSCLWCNEQVDATSEY